MRTVSESLSDSDFKLDSDLNKNLILLPLDDEKQDYQEEQLLDFTEEERDSILKVLFNFLIYNLNFKIFL